MMPIIEKSFVRRLIGRCLLTATAFAVSASAWAGGAIDAKVFNKSGEVMPDVIVYATPLDARAAPANHADTATIAQENLQFTPYVTVVQAGTEIKFPNYDKVEHHVKSFSAPKEFEIKPYQKTTPPPLLFDKTGVVIIYCLIHEWMRAYVYVVDTPYFGKSDAAGQVTLAGLPPGNYALRAWHPDMGSIRPPLMQTVKIDGEGARPVKFDFDFIPKKRKPAKAG